MKFRIYVLIYLALMLLYSKTTIAQNDTADYKYWINIGTFPGNDNLSIHYSFNFSRENLSFSALYLGSGGFLGHNYDGYSTGSITALVGYSLIKRYYLLAIYSGPGVIWGEYQYAYNFNNFCISANVQTYFLPFKNWGVGLEYITNLNKEHSLNRLHFSINYIID